MLTPIAFKNSNSLYSIGKGFLIYAVSTYNNTYKINYQTNNVTIQDYSQITNTYSPMSTRTASQGLLAGGFIGSDTNPTNRVVGITFSTETYISRGNILGNSRGYGAGLSNGNNGYVVSGYWQDGSTGSYNISLLIDKITDTSSTTIQGDAYLTGYDRGSLKDLNKGYIYKYTREINTLNLYDTPIRFDFSTETRTVLPSLNSRRTGTSINSNINSYLISNTLVEVFSGQTETIRTSYTITTTLSNSISVSSDVCGYIFTNQGKLTAFDFRTESFIELSYTTNSAYTNLQGFSTQQWG